MPLLPFSPSGSTMTRTLLALVFLALALTAFGCGGSGEEEMHTRDQRELAEPERHHADAENDAELGDRAEQD